MQILWDLEKAFIHDIMKQLPEPKPPYSTISSLVRYLVKEKKLVGYKAYGKTHEYFPLISKEEYRKQFMNSFVQDYFSNSYKSVISLFAKEENISVEDLKELIQKIENDSLQSDE